MTPELARARFAAARVAHLATADQRGIPHLVPITFALDGDEIVTAIDAKPKRRAGGPLRRLENIRANPAVSVLVDEYDEDWNRLWWARADGEASIVADGPRFDRALEVLRARYPQYGTTPLAGPVILIRVARWSGWLAA